MWKLLLHCPFGTRSIPASEDKIWYHSVFIIWFWLCFQWNRHRENLWHMVTAGVHVSLLQKPQIRLHSPSLSHPKTHPLCDSRRLVSILEITQEYTQLASWPSNYKLKTSALELSVLLVLDWHCLTHWPGLRVFK